MNLNNYKVLILSGGKSKRFGEPKALAIFNGETFLDKILSKCLSLDLDVYVVLNSDLKRLINNQSNFTSIIGDSSKDMYDSILKGIREIGQFSHLIIWPVDHPFVQIETLKILIENTDRQNFVVPSFSGKLGHPIIMPFSAKAHLNESSNLRELSATIGRNIIEVGDKEILHNINKKEDLP